MTSPGINAAEEQQRLRMDTQDSTPVLESCRSAFKPYKPVCRPHSWSIPIPSLTKVALHKIHTAGNMQQRILQSSVESPIGSIVVVVAHHLRLLFPPGFTFAVAEGNTS